MTVPDDALIPFAPEPTIEPVVRPIVTAPAFVEPAADPSNAAVRFRQPDRRLPILLVESASTRWIWLGMIVIVCALYGGMLARLYSPADGGVDQNAYLVGGRMIADHFTTRYTLPNPFAFIGNMFDLSPNGSFYPKYPFGLPLLYACCLWIFGPVHGAAAAFAVSPVCATLAVFGTFFLARLMAGSFAAVCAAILLACSQVTMLLANNPNSHASCLAFIVWGMYLLIRWWQTGTLWRGIFAGLLLGYAGLIRYSEGLLVLPIAVAAASRVRWTDWRSYLRCAAPGLAWAVPILSLLIYNKCTLGAWTGYDSNNESEFGSAFTLTKFYATWEEMLRTLHDMGLFFTLPLGVAGLAMLFRRNWVLAMMMLLWVLPGIALYTSYYWSPDRGVAYARFFLTFFPGLFVGVAVCFNDGILHGKTVDENPLVSIPLDVAVGLIVCIAAGVGVYRSINGIEGGSAAPQSDLIEQKRLRDNLAISGDHLLAKVPAGAVLFAEEGGMGESPINYFQFLRNWELFSVNAFSPTGGHRGIRFGGGGGGGGGRGGPNGPPGGGPGGFGGPVGFGGAGGGNGNGGNDALAPAPMQPELRLYFSTLYKDKTDIDLVADEKSVIDHSLAAGKRVFVVAAEAQIASFQTSLKRKTPVRDGFNRSATQPAKAYAFKTVSKWKDLPAPPPEVVPASNGFGGRRGNNFARRGGGGGGFGQADISWQLIEVIAG